jgi:hypothetical protein
VASRHQLIERAPGNLTEVHVASATIHGDGVEPAGVGDRELAAHLGHEKAHPRPESERPGAEDLHREVIVAERDPHLAEQIIATEASGVLNWALDGLADYQARGVVIPDAVSAATGAYRNASDTVALFLAESDLALEPALTMEANELVALHGDWYGSSGITEPEKAHYQRVVDTIKARGVVQKRRGQKRTRCWTGIGVAP